ncbi:MAG: hypothetical protein AAGA21_03180 [Pseudomonadota bacterium]
MKEWRHGQQGDQAGIAERHAEHRERSPVHPDICGRQNRFLAGTSMGRPDLVGVSAFDEPVMLSCHVMSSSAAADQPVISWRAHNHQDTSAFNFIAKKLTFLDGIPSELIGKGSLKATEFLTKRAIFELRAEFFETSQ